MYQDDNEITRVLVRFADEDLWLTQNQLADIYQTSKSNVSEHIKHISEDGELDKTVVVFTNTRKMRPKRTTRKRPESDRRRINQGQKKNQIRFKYLEPLLL